MNCYENKVEWKEILISRLHFNIFPPSRFIKVDCSTQPFLIWPTKVVVKTTHCSCISNSYQPLSVINDNDFKLSCVINTTAYLPNEAEKINTVIDLWIGRLKSIKVLMIDVYLFVIVLYYKVILIDELTKLRRVATFW